MRVDASLARMPSSPADGGVSVTVQRGDTLGAIAAQHNVSLKSLLDANPQIVNPDRIYPGDVVTVPSGIDGAGGGRGATGAHVETEAQSVPTEGGSGQHAKNMGLSDAGINFIKNHDITLAVANRASDEAINSLNNTRANVRTGATAKVNVSASLDIAKNPKQYYLALKGMEPDARNTTIAKLSDNELKEWGEAINSRWTSPLNAGERSDLLNLLAEGLDGQQLHRAATALGVKDMAQAVSENSSPQQKLELLTSLRDEIAATPQFDTGFGTATTYYGNEYAKAGVGILTSLKDNPGALGRAINILQKASKLDDIIKVAAGEQMYSEVVGFNSVGVVFYEDQNLQKILAGISELPVSDLHTRIEVFRAATLQLAAMQSNASTKRNELTTQRTADALSKILTREQAVIAGFVNIPLRPENVSIYQNIQLSENQKNPVGWAAGSSKGLFDLMIGRDSHTGWDWLYQQVKNGGAWDYKQLHKNRNPGEQSKYEPFGNFHFGVVASALGVPEQISLRMAGWAQTRAGTSDSDNGHWWDFNGPFGDDPEDQKQIQAGYKYHQSGLWRIWRD